MPLRIVICLLAATCLAGPAPAGASVFELFGAGPRAMSLVGALAGAGRGGEAAFHNPALLVASPLAGAWAGVSATRHALSVQLERPVCTAPAATCRGQYLAGWSSRRPQLPRDSAGFQLGWNYPLGGVFRDRVALGAALALPQRNLIRIAGADPQTPNFAQYEGMPDRLAFLFAGAVQLTPWWSVGIGTQVLAVLDAGIRLGLDPTNHRMEEASVRIGLQPRARLTAGTAIHPMRGLHLGVGWRQRLSLEYQIPTAISIGRPVDIDIALGHETLFSPDVLQIGLGWRTADDRLLVAADLTLAFWSQAPDPSPQVALDAGGAGLEALGLGQALDVGTDTPPLQLRYSDTFSPAVAIEWRAADAWVLRSGYRYRPSPAPRAIGPYNYLDNDTHAVGAGLGWRFGTLAPRLVEQLGDRDFEGDMPAAFHLDLGSQLLVLPRRTVYKRDPNDPVGHLSHGGTAWHVGLAFGGSF